jgi:hypothetical protein
MFLLNSLAILSWLRNSIPWIKSPILSFRNPPAADIRNPEQTIANWIPDLSFGSSGMTIDSICALFQKPAHGFSHSLALNDGSYATSI